MTRVAVLVRSLANGGAEKQAVLLAAALHRSFDASLHVVSREPCHGPHVEFLGRHGMEPRFVGGGALTKPWSLSRDLRGADALFTFLPSDTLLGALAGRLAGVPRIFGGLRNTGLQRRKVAALRLAHNHLLEATISNSQRAVEHFGRERGFDPAKLLVVPNGIELEPEPAVRGRRGALSILTVARFVDKKDPETALRAVAAVARELGDSIELSYRMVGYGSLEGRIRECIASLDLGRIVELCLDPPGVADFYRSADVYLSSSVHEGLSNSILEAMNHGLPIVATDAGDTDQLVASQPADGSANGFLVATGDADALAAGLVALARDVELRARMGDASYRRVVEGFSLERFRAAYEALLSAEARP